MPSNAVRNRANRYPSLEESSDIPSLPLKIGNGSTSTTGNSQQSADDRRRRRRKRKIGISSTFKKLMRQCTRPKERPREHLRSNRRGAMRSINKLETFDRALVTWLLAAFVVGAYLYHTVFTSHQTIPKPIRIVGDTSLRGQRHNAQSLKRKSLKDFALLPILFKLFGTIGMATVSPPPLNHDLDKGKEHPDYGGLMFDALVNGESRKILYDPRDDEGRVLLASYNSREDDVDTYWNYYAYDDDYVKSTYYESDSEESPSQNGKYCRMTNWQLDHHPTCNDFHEVGLNPNKGLKYLSHGYYRDVFVVDDGFQNLTVKQMRWEFPFDKENFENTRADVIVGEKLTSADNIVDVYGHCGQALMSEYLSNGDVESHIIGGNQGFIDPAQLHDEQDVRPQNNLSVEDKVLIALEMAESIASVHGFKDGVIVHSDIQLGQFLISDDGGIKLNDFNRAETMLYDEGNEQYCKFNSGAGAGNYRAPEEYHDFPLDEKIDLFSMGNNIYALLTGLYIFYDLDEKDAPSRISRGELAYIDPRYRSRSFGEKRLVEIMMRCWEYKPDDRADIFEVVDFLKDTWTTMEAMKDEKEGDTKKGAAPQKKAVGATENDNHGKNRPLAKQLANATKKAEKHGNGNENVSVIVPVRL